MGFKKGVSGNPAGRPLGKVNAATLAMRELARTIVTDPNVQKKLLEDAQAGTLQPAVMIAMFHYYGGKPKDTVEMTTPEGEGVASVVLYLPRNGREVFPTAKVKVAKRRRKAAVSETATAVAAP